MFNFDIDSQLIEGESISDADLITVFKGEEFDLNQVGIKKHTPTTRDFIIFEHKSA
jgi:hypothetical protein